MAMEYEAMFSIMSKCFASTERDEWEAITANRTWTDFIDALRRALQDEHGLAETVRPIHRLHEFCPLQDFLSQGETSALFCPPSFEEKKHFSACHFTGGLPASAVPVESLYARRLNAAAPMPPQGGRKTKRDNTNPMQWESFGGGAYGCASARYMRELIERMGFEVPREFAACPDHLALELDMEAVLLRSGLGSQAETFFIERFAWLGSYRLRLIQLGKEANFYVALVDVLTGMWARLGSPEPVEA